MFGWILVAVLWMMIWFLLGCIFTEWRIKNFPLIKVGCDEYGFPILRPEDIPPMPKCKPPLAAIKVVEELTDDKRQRTFIVKTSEALAIFGEKGIPNMSDPHPTEKGLFVHTREISFLGPGHHRVFVRYKAGKITTA